MAGAQEVEEREAEMSIMVARREQWQWQVQFARCFTYPSSLLPHATTSSPSPSSPPPLLSPIKRSVFKPIWISSSGFSTVSLHPSACGSSSSDSILTVSLNGRIIEEHLISKLHFVWPQVSCISGFPGRGSLVVLASYTDSADEKQKFALRFSAISEVEDFISSLEDILLNRIPNGLPAVDVISAISSQSEFVPPYRPDTSSVRTPIYASSMPNNLHNEAQQESRTHDMVADSDSNVVAFPPRFTSLVSSCSADIEQGKLAITLVEQPQELDLKAQIAKYMQDASFLDMVNKVNDVITELGGDFLI